jgi:predicted Zn-dependent peptidase
MALAVYVRAGSRHETPENNGVSHFLEHLFFRGSEGYPDSRTLHALVEDAGGSLNGVTTRDHGYYYTPIHPEGLGVAMDVLGDLLTRPLLKEIDVERQVILEEMLDEVDDEGRDIDVDNLSKRMMFGTHPLSYKIAGTTDTVGRMTIGEVRAHFARCYGARNMVLCAAGKVGRAQVLELAARAFGRLPPREAMVEAPAPAAPDGPRLHFVEHEEAQTEFRLTFPAPDEDHADFAPLIVLRRVLDDGLSSRLQLNIVEKKGLAYAIHAGIDTFAECSLFEVDGASAPEKVPAVIEEAFRVLAELREGGPAPDEVRRAQVRHRMHLEFSLDSAPDLAGWFGGTEIFRPPESFEERCRRVEAVTPADVARGRT